MAKKPAKKAKKVQKAKHSARKPKFKTGKKTPRLKTKSMKHKSVKHVAKNVAKKKPISTRAKKTFSKKAKKAVSKTSARVQEKKLIATLPPEPTPIQVKLPPKSARAKYTFLEHTADIMVLAQGKDFSIALQQAGLAMFSVLGKAKPLDSFEIEETARTRADLVVYVLARILSECDVHEMVPAHFDILEYDEKTHRIKAQVWGEHIRPKDAIKAVTYHRLEVREEKGLCFIQVVFDV